LTGKRFESKKFKFRAMGHDSGCDLVWTDLSVSYGDKVGLKSVDGFVQKGKMVAVMGATGAGKTTLLNALTKTKF